MKGILAAAGLCRHASVFRFVEGGMVSDYVDSLGISKSFNAMMLFRTFIRNEIWKKSLD
jgi:hypothetical protein